MSKIFRLCVLLLPLLLWMPGAMAQSALAKPIASPLAERLAHFPHWDGKPPVQAAQGDLVYPEWMANTWEVTSTLTEAVAPLAPAIATPGFEQNRQYLHQPVRFLVRFVAKRPAFSNRLLSLPAIGFASALRAIPPPQVVADRAFNGIHIARAYVGDAALSVQVDSQNPNRQITQLRSGQLVSTVSDRASETPSPTDFIATEMTQQVFRIGAQIYFNEVETTTAYHLMESGNVTADQVTALYLSPQDPDYFKAGGHPVALYRYRLELTPRSP